VSVLGILHGNSEGEGFVMLRRFIAVRPDRRRWKEMV